MKRERSSSSLGDCATQLDDTKTPENDALENIRPTKAAYCPRFGRAERAVGDAVTGFVTKYEQRKAAGYRSKEIERLASELANYRLPAEQYPRSLPMSLCGAMGAGKSLTLSCLLDTIDISPDSDSHTRGTVLVSEFSDSKAWQNTKYRVNAVYLAPAEIRATIKKRCGEIFAFLECTDESGNQDDAEVEDPEVEAEDYEAAIQYLHMLVCGDSCFETEVDLEDYFQSQYNQWKTSATQPQRAISKAVVDTMMKSVTNMMATKQTEALLASTTEQLSAARSTVSGSDTAGGPQTWPVISMIEVRCKTPLLIEGIAIADTPGNTDTDRWVVEGTNAYIDRGGPVIIVAPIERCGKDGELTRMVKSQMFRKEQMFLVLTKTDKVTNTLTPQDRKDMDPKLAANLQSAEESMAQLQEEVQTLEAHCERLLQNPTGEAFIEHTATKARQALVSKSIIQAKNRIRQVAVENRNITTKAFLKEKFRKLSNLDDAPEVEVVCVSGSEYKKHLGHAADEDPPWLSKEETGIPELQRLILGIPATERYEALHHIATDHLPDCLRRIVRTLMPKSSPTTAGDDLRSTILQFWDEYRSKVMKLLRVDMRDAYEAEFARCFKNLSNSGAWETQAKTLLSSWSKYRANTFKAFCKRDGLWRPKGERDSISWNEGIGSFLGQQVGPGFNALSRQNSNNRRAAKCSAVTLFERLSSALQEDVYTNVPEQDDLIAVFQHATSAMQKLTNQAFNQFSRDLNKIYSNAVMRDTTAESYISRAMHTSYVNAVLAKGALHNRGNGKKPIQGSAHRARVGILRAGLLGSPEDPSVKKLAAPSVVDAVAQHAQEEFTDKLDLACGKLWPELDKIIDSVLHDFDMRWSASCASAAEDAQHTEVKIRAERDAHHADILIRAAQHAIDQLEGPIKGHLDACMEYENSATQNNTAE
ncbi:unnamed protein product [Zymoseptoria tritici ST99CH_3D1]|uniref:DUF7605 domain-containing protein n=3 Tax=Zymoseptoria tritici TaxID=1047171 RepID=F9X391_ZYMTI|nr:uncharacterized protein MYCGRDRAFT_108298 [Zymoseptoria tritici IPO323]EGP90298.1 hypothetical protein MYCGRDRAFT_108298 [Zymoseptoria tritici IPO323]SMQ48097.1 unnamed protein product [Zymoseptoria tritici ST99CH_3D7]SMR46642.1 unnamed protein product [Zymoseptoria tritici ST99CH_1E4]SMR47885.1 unnamed protein product [Zymoseptoria tritici ST99CH_3D1]